LRVGGVPDPAVPPAAEVGGRHACCLIRSGGRLRWPSVAGRRCRQVAWCFQLEGSGSARPGRRYLVVVVDPFSDVYRLGEPAWRDSTKWTLPVQVGTSTSGKRENRYKLMLLDTEPGLPGLRNNDPRLIDRTLFDHYVDRGDIVVLVRLTVRRAEDTSSCRTGV